MNRFKNVIRVLTLVLVAGILFSCGKSSEGEDTDKTAQTATPEVQDAGEGAVLSLDEAPFRDVLKQAGYEAVFYRQFPAPIPGKKGSVVAYQSAEGGEDGGVLYFEGQEDLHTLVWHWHFDEAPVWVTPVEVNEDGLWDMRINTKNGGQFELLHEESFALYAGKRNDLIALNGTSSDAVDPKYRLWHCFDGDTTTVWTMSVKGGDGAYIEVKTPLGVTDGILSVQAPQGKGPKDCEIVVDGTNVQSLELQDTAGKQLVSLDPAVQAAKSIRLVVKSSYADNEEVSIAEIGIK